MKKITLAFISVIGFTLLSSSASWAQVVEKIYAGNLCAKVTDDGQGIGDPYDGGVFYNFNDSITNRGSLDTVDNRLRCPIVRQKINSGAGAKFYVYVSKGGTQAVTCTMTSRRPHNSALVSSGTRAVLAGDPGGEYRLARSIAPSSTWGHYTLNCHLDGFPTIHSYRMKEF